MSNNIEGFEVKGKRIVLIKTGIVKLPSKKLVPIFTPNI
jgi:hypothetical protein